MGPEEVSVHRLTCQITFLQSVLLRRVMRDQEIVHEEILVQ